MYPRPMVTYRRSAGPVFWELKTCEGAWHSTLPHCHAEWSLGLVESGACRIGCGGTEERVEAPALVWFSPETVHECVPEQTSAWGFRMIYWRAPGVSGLWGIQPLGPGESSPWKEFLDGLDGEVPAPVPGWLAERGFGGPAAAVAPPVGTKPPDRALARPDRPYKRLWGLAPRRHRTILKLRWGQELLRRGLAPAEAALEAGFYDQSQFTRAFRALTGTTPGQF